MNSIRKGTTEGSFTGFIFTLLGLECWLGGYWRRTSQRPICNCAAADNRELRPRVFARPNPVEDGAAPKGNRSFYRSGIEPARYPGGTCLVAAVPRVNPVLEEGSTIWYSQRIVVCERFYWTGDSVKTYG